jgi:putative ABC transport system substrate-binding protein
VFALVAEARADGLIVGDSPENHSHSSVIVDLAARSRIPAVYPERAFAVAGGLVSYGIDYPSLFRRMGAQIAQILGGSKPGTIPFVQASRFELVINLKAAKALGLSLPESMLVSATEVIE